MDNNNRMILKYIRINGKAFMMISLIARNLPVPSNLPLPSWFYQFPHCVASYCKLTCDKPITRMGVASVSTSAQWWQNYKATARLIELYSNTTIKYSQVKNRLGLLYDPLGYVIE